MGLELPKTIEELEALFWANNHKPAQIWAHSKHELKDDGFTWTIFLKLLRMRRDLIILLESGELSLALFIMEISAAAKSPIGVFLVERGG